MKRSRFVVLLAMIGMVAGSLLAHAQHSFNGYDQVVNKATSQLSLTSAKNPSNINDGTAAVLQVLGSGPYTATGQVTFSAVAGGNIGSGQTVETATIALDGTGKASWVFNLPVGTYLLVAVYSGDTNFSAGQATLTQEVLGPADFSLVLEPGSLVVKQGQTWNGTLKATSINNFSGMISMSCDGGGTAVLMTCLPGQPLLLRASAPTEFPVSITTTVTVLRVVGSSGLVLLGLGFGSRNQRRRRRMYALAMLCGLLVVAGCGGIRYEQRDGTPKGNYKMTFVGQSGSLSHAVSFTVTVQ